MLDRLPELGKENASAVSTPAAGPVQPLQPQNCNTPRPVARPAGELTPLTLMMHTCLPALPAASTVLVKGLFGKSASAMLCRQAACHHQR